MTESRLAVVSPLDGTVASLESVPDPIFASCTVGAGIAVVPDPGVEVVSVTAPISGIVTRVQPHVFVIGTGEQRILVHLGVDTARLNGQGFDVHFPEGSVVEAGMAMCTYTPKELGRMGYDPIVVIVAMQTNYHDIGGAVIPGEPIGSGDVLFRC